MRKQALNPSPGTHNLGGALTSSAFLLMETV